MDGDDAPHAGDDSGKHLCIFAEIACPAVQPWQTLRRGGLKRVATCQLRHHTQVRPDQVNRLKLQRQRL